MLLMIGLSEETQQVAAEGEGRGCKGEFDRSPVRVRTVASFPYLYLYLYLNTSNLIISD